MRHTASIEGDTASAASAADCHRCILPALRLLSSTGSAKKRTVPSDKANNQRLLAREQRPVRERHGVVLPQHGIRLIELDHSMFRHDGRKRLRREFTADVGIIRAAL